METPSLEFSQKAYREGESVDLLGGAGGRMAVDSIVFPGKWQLLGSCKRKCKIPATFIPDSTL